MIAIVVVVFIVRKCEGRHSKRMKSSSVHHIVIADCLSHMESTTESDYTQHLPFMSS